jgi:hypothetical protein
MDDEQRKRAKTEVLSKCENSSMQPPHSITAETRVCCGKFDPLNQVDGVGAGTESVKMGAAEMSEASKVKP